MTILLIPAFVVALVGFAHAACERTETSERFVRIVETCGKTSVKIARLDTPILENACSKIEATAAIVELRMMAAGAPDICTKNGETMKVAIKAFRAAIDGAP